MQDPRTPIPGHTFGTCSPWYRYARLHTSRVLAQYFVRQFRIIRFRILLPALLMLGFNFPIQLHGSICRAAT
jgi:hypothetical protein